MIAGKWNFKTREYEKYILPERATLLTTLGTVICCAACGKEVLYDYTYTSKKIHTSVGMGFCVCNECYTNELAEDKLSRLESEDLYG